MNIITLVLTNLSIDSSTEANNMFDFGFKIPLLIVVLLIAFSWFSFLSVVFVG